MVLWPLIFLTVIAAVIAVAVPVLMLADPQLTPDAIAHGLLRVLHIVPLMWGPLALLGLLSEIIPVLWRQSGQLPVNVREMWDLLSGKDSAWKEVGAGRSSDLTRKQRG
ncbi:hypothetical protein [Pantoea ananatis]|uniref:hypothetical protein n=1 Tax=Pantoea ananas TaxID=553 RepID=UPI00157692D8|nr:hypothetical protein [Pantoea ananatis]